MMNLPNDLPRGLIGLHTPNGQKMLNETTTINENIIQNEMKQLLLKNSGPASLAFVINALYAIHHVKFTEQMLNENDIIYAEKNNVKHLFQLMSNKINETGMTIANLSHVAMLLGFGVHSFYALNEAKIKKSDYDDLKLKSLLMEKQWETSLVETELNFRELVRDYIKKPVTGIIANFDMSKLGYTSEIGHFSPIAAYHEIEDMFLVMVVSPFATPAWVKTSLLFEAMSTVDAGSNLPRGFLRINVLL